MILIIDLMRWKSRMYFIIHEDKRIKKISNKISILL